MIDARKIRGAFSKGLPTGVAVAALNNVNERIRDAIRQATNDQNFFEGKSVGDLQPVYSMILTLVEARNPAFAQAVRNAGNEFFTSAITYCEANKGGMGGAAALVKALTMRSTMVGRQSLTNGDDYLVIMKDDVAAALVESGVTDAKIIAEVKDAMLMRGQHVLANATTLKELSDFLASAKTEARTLAKTLEGIEKARKGALKTATTTIAAFSGISKMYLTHKLNVSSVKEDLGHLYADLLAKAKNGENIDGAATLNKANDIVSKFALGKGAVLQAIDKAGFDPAECAAHKFSALRCSVRQKGARGDSQVCGTAVSGDDTCFGETRPRPGLASEKGRRKRENRGDVGRRHEELARHPSRHVRLGRHRAPIHSLAFVGHLVVSPSICYGTRRTCSRTLSASYWTTVNSGGVKYYNADGTSAHAWDKSGSVTLWAKWEQATAKVTLGKNGGTQVVGMSACGVGAAGP